MSLRYNLDMTPRLIQPGEYRVLEGVVVVSRANRPDLKYNNAGPFMPIWRGDTVRSAYSTGLCLIAKRDLK